MNQFDVFEQLQLTIDRYERTFDKQFMTMQQKMTALIDDYYTQYGEEITTYTKYNRLNTFKREMDQVATAQYNQMVQQLETGQNELSTEMYLAMAYLLHMYINDEEGQMVDLTSAAAKTVVGVAVVLALLKLAKKPSSYLTESITDLVLIFEKHKNDYVYGVFNDIKENLRTSAGYIEASKAIKKRTEAIKNHGITRLYEVMNDVINFTQDKVHNVSKDVLKTEKMWVSMRDLRVRFSHRILDSQLADKDGYFHYRGDKAKRPKTWKDPDMNWGCRCKVVLLFNGKLPRISKITDYHDKDYQEKMRKRIVQLQKEEDKTYLQAFQIADKEIKAPKRKVPGYISFDDWHQKYYKQKK